MPQNSAIDHLIDDHESQAEQQAEARQQADRRPDFGRAHRGSVYNLFRHFQSLLVVRRQIIQPISTITHAMSRLAEGDRTIEVPEMGARR